MEDRSASVMTHSRAPLSVVGGHNPEPVAHRELVLPAVVLVHVAPVPGDMPTEELFGSLLGLLQYLTPTLQLLCGVVVFHEPMPAARLVGFVLVWVALAVLAADALGARRRTLAVPVVEPT